MGCSPPRSVVSDSHPIVQCMLTTIQLQFLFLATLHILSIHYQRQRLSTGWCVQPGCGGCTARPRQQYDISDLGTERTTAPPSRCSWQPHSADQRCTATWGWWWWSGYERLDVHCSIFDQFCMMAVVHRIYAHAHTHAYKCILLRYSARSHMHTFNFRGGEKAKVSFSTYRKIK